MSEATRTQKDRPLEIATSLGDDKLLILSLHGTESLGRLFQYELDLMAETSPIDYKDILGKNVTVRLALRGGGNRFFNGFISRFMLVSVDEANKDHQRLFYYRATMVPWAWFLSRVADCRIFQNKSVPDIIKQIFSDRGFSDFKDQTNGTYNPWVYCVQYRETDFNFISRLMENEGIYYYFEHENGKHSIVLCDAPTAHKPAPNYDNLHFDQPDLKSTHDAFVWNWTLGNEVTPNQYALTDYNPLQPKTDLMASANVEHSHDPGPYEIFDYPGGYDKVPDGKNYAKVRMAEIESQYATAHAATSARAIFAGCTFTLQDHPACDPEEYLITSVAYQLQNDDIGGGAGRTRSVPAFQAQITCIPHKYAFRSQRLTPKPIVQGPQTAVVVGPKGEEIHTDKHGQVKVKFFWDRDPKKDETSSCWVRVSQPSAGLGWGSLNIPRIGQEVIVDFLEGDPDRPIITGRVYNGVNMPPNNLPGAQVLTSFKSNSSKGGGGFNEITLDDTKGKENVFIHGEYDMNVRVKHDRMETIVNDQHLVVQNNTYLNVTADVHENIGGNMQENIGGDHSENIGGKEAKAVGGSMSLNVSGDVAEKFGANHSETTGSKITFKTPHFVIVADTISFKASGNTVAIGPGGVTIKVQGDLKIESSGSTKIKAGTAFKAEALSSKLEGSVIVKVSGLVAKVEADTSLSLKGGTGAKMEGAKIDVSADGPCIVKGAVIMLN